MAGLSIPPDALAHEHSHAITAQEFVDRVQGRLGKNVVSWFIGQTWYLVWYKWTGLKLWVSTRGGKKEITNKGVTKKVSLAYWNHPDEIRARKWASDPDVVKHYPHLAFTLR
jgi:hypothetical protein